MEIITIETHEIYVKAAKVRNAFLSYSTKQSTLLELFKTHNEDARKLLGISKTQATLSKYDRAYRRLGEFMQAKYKITDIALKEINYKFITDFETYLHTVSKCNQLSTLLVQTIHVGKQLFILFVASKSYLIC